MLLSCEEERLIGKLLEENKDWFVGMFASVVPWNGSFTVHERFVWVRCRGISLHLWSRHCFESVGALVGKVVEVDRETLAREVLEYVRLRVSIPVGVFPSIKREVSINGISCSVVFKMEMCMPDHKLRSFFSKWGHISVLESVASSKEDRGKECLDSVGSHCDDEKGSREGEELTVHCPAVQAEPSLRVAQQNCVLNVVSGLRE